MDGSFPRDRLQQLNAGQDGSGRAKPDLQSQRGGAPPAGWNEKLQGKHRLRRGSKVFLY